MIEYILVATLLFNIGRADGNITNTISEPLPTEKICKSVGREMESQLKYVNNSPSAAGPKKYVFIYKCVKTFDLR